MTDSALSDLPVVGHVDLCGPGILGLFAQGVLTGLLISQFSTFLDCMERNSRGLVALAAFVTTVALLQSGIFLVAVWRNDVLHKYNLTWIEPTQPIFTTLMSAPVQAYLIWRFWPILRYRRWIVGPLVFLLVLSVSGKIALTTKILEAEYHGTLAKIHTGNARFGLYPFFLSAVVPPTILDIVVTSIRVYHLRNLLKQVHAQRIRRRIMRLIIIGWQAAVPPTVCTIAYLAIYLLFTILWPGKGDHWFIAIESVLGKLYVISFFFILNNRVPFSNDSTSYLPTLPGAIGDVGQGTLGGHQEMPLAVHRSFPLFTRQNHSSAAISGTTVDLSATQK